MLSNIECVSYNYFVGHFLLQTITESYVTINYTQNLELKNVSHSFVVKYRFQQKRLNTQIVPILCKMTMNDDLPHHNR